MGMRVLVLWAGVWVGDARGLLSVSLIRNVSQQSRGNTVVIMVTHNLDRKHAQISLICYRKI